MENSITIFKNPAFGEIFTIKDEKQQPWFVGNDIAKVLGYSNYRNAIVNHVDDEDKLRIQIEYAGQKREVTVINESGLYALILSSKLPQAKEFKHWVTSEVLPSIRKDGGYIVTRKDETPEEVMARAILIAKKTIERLEQENQLLSQKADHLDNVILCNQCYTMTQVAKELGMTVYQLTDYLLEKRIIFRQSKQYMLYAEYACLGLAKNRTGEKIIEDGTVRVFHPQLVWTEKGRRFIHNLVKANPPRVNQRIAVMLTQPTLFSIS